MLKYEEILAKSSEHNIEYMWLYDKNNETSPAEKF